MSSKRLSQFRMLPLTMSLAMLFTAGAASAQQVPIEGELAEVEPLRVPGDHRHLVLQEELHRPRAVVARRPARHLWFVFRFLVLTIPWIFLIGLVKMLMTTRPRSSCIYQLVWEDLNNFTK